MTNTFDNTTVQCTKVKPRTDISCVFVNKNSSRGNAILESIVEKNLVSRRILSGNTHPSIISVFNYIENIQNCCSIK
jgi:hypothetical protein